MKRIFICSPWRSSGPAQRALHERWMHWLCRAALEMGHAPFAPHGFYPGLLDDADEAQRAAGIAAGLAWLEACDEVWALRVGPTPGMVTELERAAQLCLPVCYFDTASLDATGASQPPSSNERSATPWSTQHVQPPHMVGIHFPGRGGVAISNAGQAELASGCSITPPHRLTAARAAAKHPASLPFSNRRGDDGPPNQ